VCSSDLPDRAPSHVGDFSCLIRAEVVGTSLRGSHGDAGVDDDGRPKAGWTAE
jgi:hypothetical protein